MTHNERRAQIIATETTDLDRSERVEVDAVIADDLDGLGDAALRDRVQHEALRRDQTSALERRERARARRQVTGRILADGVAMIRAIIPTEQYSAIITSLDDAASRVRAAGDSRTRAQVVADTFVQRLGGPTPGAPTPVALKIVVTAETLLGLSQEPAHLLGAGWIPASRARELARDGVEHLRSTWQRLFAEPTTGSLITMDSTSPLFRGELAEFLTLRDRRCRTPYCNGRIRHHDHIQPRAHGGPTHRDNGQGLCEACNYTKETPGWHHQTVEDPLTATTINITTPTGHRHRSRAPDPPAAS